MLDFCGSYCDPIKFPLSSQDVPQNVPNSFSLYPTLKTSIYNPKEEVRTYLFWNHLKLDLFICFDGPNRDAHHINKIYTKKLCSFSQLINMTLQYTIMLKYLNKVFSCFTLQRGLTPTWFLNFHCIWPLDVFGVLSVFP